MTPEGLKSIHELQEADRGSRIATYEAGWRVVVQLLPYQQKRIRTWQHGSRKVPFVLEEERQLLPETDETDGFYFARLRRRT